MVPIKEEKLEGGFTSNVDKTQNNSEVEGDHSILNDLSSKSKGNLNIPGKKSSTPALLPNEKTS